MLVFDWDFCFDLVMILFLTLFLSGLATVADYAFWGHRHLSQHSTAHDYDQQRSLQEDDRLQQITVSSEH